MVGRPERVAARRWHRPPALHQYDAHAEARGLAPDVLRLGHGRVSAHGRPHAHSALADDVGWRTLHRRTLAGVSGGPLDLHSGREAISPLLSAARWLRSSVSSIWRLGCGPPVCSRRSSKPACAPMRSTVRGFAGYSLAGPRSASRSRRPPSPDSLKLSAGALGLFSWPASCLPSSSRITRSSIATVSRPHLLRQGYNVGIARGNQLVGRGPFLAPLCWRRRASSAGFVSVVVAPEKSWRTRA